MLSPRAYTFGIETCFQSGPRRQYPKVFRHILCKALQSVQSSKHRLLVTHTSLYIPV